MGPHSSHSRSTRRSLRLMCASFITIFPYLAKQKLTMWTYTLPLTLLVLGAAAFPIEDYDDYSAVSLQSHPVDTEVAYWEDQDGAEEWNEIRQVVEPRHLARRSPICKRSASPCIIKKSKKLLLKAKKLKPIWKPKAKKLAKKLAIVGIPTAGVALAGGGGGFALSQALGGGGGQGF